LFHLGSAEDSEKTAKNVLEKHRNLSPQNCANEFTESRRFQ
jgi:hypothetical protein